MNSHQERYKTEQIIVSLQVVLCFAIGYLTRSHILVMLLAALVRADQTMADSIHYRVVEGRDARENEYPFVITFLQKIYHWDNSLEANADFFKRTCTGSLISSVFAVTAAICLNPLVDYVRCGNMSIPMNATVCKSKILKKFVHPGFIKRHNDIGLVKIKPIVMKEYGRLLANDYKSLIGRAVKFAGFGQIQLKNDFEHKVELTLKPLQIGEGVILGSFTERIRDPLLFIAPKCSKHKQHAYFGDSGSPLLLLGKIVGVASSYNKLNSSHEMVMSGFTPISPYIDWISHTINMNRN